MRYEGIAFSNGNKGALKPSEQIPTVERIELLPLKVKLLPFEVNPLPFEVMLLPYKE